MSFFKATHPQLRHTVVLKDYRPCMLHMAYQDDRELRNAPFHPL
jgi:hypothetical protein